MKRKATVLVLTAIAFALFAFMPKAVNQQPWPVPDKYKKMSNPSKDAAAAVAAGKALWGQHCKSCHGTKGKGDGPKASQLDTDCGDFTKASFQSQTDGELFYKTLEGRKDMPSYKKKIPDENDLWALVSYMRTLK